jgi:hypothetical protein
MNSALYTGKVSDIKQLCICVFPEAKARIMGPADLYVKTGSSVSLTCVISQGPHDLGTVFWYRGSAIIHQPVLTTGQPQPRVRIDTDWTDHLTSRLHISKALPSDSGNYTCIPTIAEPASVNVHVINGKSTFCTLFEPWPDDQGSVYGRVNVTTASHVLGFFQLLI